MFPTAFTHGQVVRLKTKSIRFIVIGIIREDLAGVEPIVTYRIRHLRSHGNAFEFVVSPHEIEGVDAREPWQKGLLICPKCGGSGGGDDPAIRCRVCHGTGTLHDPDPQADKPTAITPVHATIRHEPFVEAQGIIDGLSRETMETLLDLKNQDYYANNAEAIHDAIDRAQPTPPTLLEWSDRENESDTACGRYQADKGPNGWHGYHYFDAGNTTPDLESDGPFKTREEARRWCERHAAGEALEPKRCERCQMPTAELPLCPACNHNDETGQTIGGTASGHVIPVDLNQSPF